MATKTKSEANGASKTRSVAKRANGSVSRSSESPSFGEALERLSKASEQQEKKATKTTKAKARTSSKRTAGSSKRSSNGPSETDIARRAFEIYQRRGGSEGNPEQDWFQAQQELQSEQSA